MVIYMLFWEKGGRWYSKCLSTHVKAKTKMDLEHLSDQNIFIASMQLFSKHGCYS